MYNPHIDCQNHMTHANVAPSTEGYKQLMLNRLEFYTMLINQSIIN